MTLDKIDQSLEQAGGAIAEALSQPETWAQVAVVCAVYLLAFVLAQRLRRHVEALQPLADARAARIEAVAGLAGGHTQRASMAPKRGS